MKGKIVSFVARTISVYEVCASSHYIEHRHVLVVKRECQTYCNLH